MKQLDNEKNFKQSMATYLQRVALSGFLATWAILGIIYWAVRASGSIYPWLSSPAFGIPLAAGIFAVAILPITMRYVLFPLQVRLNEFGISYKYAGLTKQISWEQVTEINHRSMSPGRYNSDRTWIVIASKRDSISIPPYLNVSAKDFLYILLDFVKNNSRTSVSGLPHLAEVSTLDQTSLARLQGRVSRVRRVYIFVIIVIVTFFGSGMWIIFYSLRLLHTLQ